jgi:hypothetical protein
MKTPFHCLIIVLLLVTGPAFADFESDVIDLVNAEREARGIRPLSYDADLAAAARAHSQDMGIKNYVGHDSLDGTTFDERIMAEGYICGSCGENIAVGHTGPKAVVDAWMSSSGHRENILREGFCDIGVGYAFVNGSTYHHYWTQDFGRYYGVAECTGEITPPPGSDKRLNNTAAGGEGCFIASARSSTVPLWIFGLILLGLHFEEFLCCQLKRTISVLGLLKMLQPGPKGQIATCKKHNQNIFKRK